jgi:hypothetical protein
MEASVMTAATAIPEFTRTLQTDIALGDDASTSMDALTPRNPPGRSSAPMHILRIVLDPKDEEALGMTWEKRAFRVPPRDSRINMSTPIAVVTAELPQIGYPEDAITALPSWLFPWQQPEAEADSWRGVFAVEHEHRELFSGVVELDLRALPRWEPHITITRRMLETDDE